MENPERILRKNLLSLDLASYKELDAATNDVLNALLQRGEYKEMGTNHSLELLRLLLKEKENVWARVDNASRY